MGLNLKILKNEPCIIRMTLYTENVADQTDHFADVFVRENVAYGYDVVTFEITQPTPFLFREIQCKKWTIKCFRSVFSANWVGIR